MQAHLSEAPLDFLVRGDAADWGLRLEARMLPTGSLRLERARGLTKLPGYEEGHWWVQDAAAALPASLLAPLADRLVYDLCAAPGGKTIQLAVAGARVVAVDRQPARLERLRGNLLRTGMAASVQVVAADVLSWEPGELADAVLLDAPCSATGSIRRHPDIARLKSKADVQSLAVEQARLLQRAGTMVKPGGILIYCTCSLEPEEGEQQIEAFLSGGAPFTRQPVLPEEVGGQSGFINPQGDIRTLPGDWADIGGIDGFFIARLRRH